MLIEALKAKQYSQNTKQENELNKTLKGVLINNHVKNSDNVSFDDIQNSLLVYNSDNYSFSKKENEDDKKESSFNVNKAIKPLLLATGVIIAGSVGLSSILAKSSKAKINSQAFEQLPDLAINMNIKEEPQFAIYRAIRDPNFSNILGALAIFIMSAITIASKNFVDGAKEIWVKKQSADIEKNLQENLIEVETNSFSGKLNVVNDMMNKNIKHFDELLNNKKSIFDNFISFKSKKNDDENKDKKNFSEIKNNKNLKYLALVTGVVASAIIAGKVSINNIRKTAQYSNQYANDFTTQTINAINNLSENANKNDLPKITEFLKSICAKPEYINEVGKKYNLTSEEINNLIKNVEETKKTKFADAPTALGGIPKKIQYYCYIDENRGHLYNWVLNPDNKFTKYIFLSFTLSSAIGYLFKEGMDALKDVAVLKENAKTELDLRKRLVDVEIANFKAKKESAINPLVENFEKQVNEGSKSKEELKQIADNILSETKNGPPYVYT
jgi:hypothetical protein